MMESDPAREEDEQREEGSGITHALRSISADMVRIVTLETRLFGYTVLVMVGMAVAIALLLVGAWLFAGAALVVALADLPVLNLSGALLIVTLMHLALAVLVVWRLRYITRDLTFRESRASVSSLMVQVQAIGDAVAVDAEKNRQRKEEEAAWDTSESESSDWRGDKSEDDL